jgi:predicted RNase H-like nuclease (RuvC/YqgF family)
MAANEKTITLFTMRVRQMILQFQQLKKDNEELYAMVDDRDAKIRKLEAQVQQAQRDYNSLKMAKMLEVTDGDLEGAKKRVASLIRDVNSCITLLSGSEE